MEQKGKVAGSSRGQRMAGGVEERLRGSGAGVELGTGKGRSKDNSEPGKHDCVFIRVRHTGKKRVETCVIHP